MLAVPQMGCDHFQTGLVRIMWCGVRRSYALQERSRGWKASASALPWRLVVPGYRRPIRSRSESQFQGPVRACYRQRAVSLLFFPTKLTPAGSSRLARPSFAKLLGDECSWHVAAALESGEFGPACEKAGGMGSQQGLRQPWQHACMCAACCSLATDVLRSLAGAGSSICCGTWSNVKRSRQSRAEKEGRVAINCGATTLPVPFILSQILPDKSKQQLCLGEYYLRARQPL